MSEEVIEVSSGYRNSRRNTSILCGVGIAWAAAQFEIKSFSLGSLGMIGTEKASVHIIIAILCIYCMVKCTIEYMMQSEPVRRWNLAQLDYRITLYLVRFTIVALIASAIARTWEMVIYVACIFLFFVFSFFVLAFIYIFFTMPIRLFIRHLSGRISVASAAIEATFYSFLLSGLTHIIIIGLIAFNVINPFEYFNAKFQIISNIQLIFFSSTCLVTLLCFFFDKPFLNMVFAFEPEMIEKKSYKDGQTIISIVPNPKHPKYRK